MILPRISKYIYETRLTQVAMKNTMQQQNQQQEQELISPELIAKFDGDKELVQKFMENGYSAEQLEQSTITHPTYTDPVCTLKDGKVAGFWL